MPTKILKAMTVTAAAALALLILHAGEPANLWWWAFAVPFAAWIIGPAVLPYGLARRFIRRDWFAWLMIVVLAASSGWSAYVYYDAFFVSASSTAGLVMIFAPLYQYAALACVAVLSAFLASFLERDRA